MKTIWLTALIGLPLCLVTGCDRGAVKVTSSPQPPATMATNAAASAIPPITMPIPTTADDTNAVALIQTTAGDMVVEFWPEVAPKTVASFKMLASTNFYDGTCFHRIMKSFMAQGGDPLSKDKNKEAQWGTGDPGYKIDAEFNDRSHQRGVLSMARSGDRQKPERPEFLNSAGSQFFICLGDASFLDHQYTAFGKVIKGDDVLGKIGDTAVGPSASGERSKPLTRVEVTSIKLFKRDSIK